MTDTALDQLLARLEDSKADFVVALEGTDPSAFDQTDDDGESVKTILERAADELDFYLGKLIALALNLPQPPLLTHADYGSLREGIAALELAHRRLANLLHDLVPGDLEKTASDPDLGSYTLRQLLELASAQYTLRATQVRRLPALPGQAKA